MQKIKNRINHFMKSKNLFFSVDRLGDYLIRSNVIKKVSEYYDYNEIICSNINFKLIKNQNFFNKISIFESNFSFFQKLSCIRIFLNSMIQSLFLMVKIFQIYYYS